MAPSSPAPASSSAWEPSTVIELLALTLTVPGAISALVTLYIVVSRHQKNKRQTKQGQRQDATLPLEPEFEVEPVHNPPAYSSAHSIATTTTALDDGNSTTVLIHRFNEHLHVLHATTAEREEWEDELALRRGAQDREAQWVDGLDRRMRMDTEVVHVV